MLRLKPEEKNRNYFLKLLQNELSLRQNSNILIPKFLQPNFKGHLDFSNYKNSVRSNSLKYLTLIPLACKDMGLENLSLSQRLISFM